MDMRVTTTIRNASRLEWLVFFSGSCVSAVSILLYYNNQPAANVLIDDVRTGITLIVLAWLSSCFELLSSRPRTYRIAALTRIGAVLLLMMYVARDPQIAPLLVSILVAEIGIYEAYPRNLIIGVSTVVSTSIVRIITLRYLFDVPPDQVVEPLILHLFIGLLVAAATSFLVRWRDELIESRREERRLDGMVVQLTEANVQSQDFARDVQEIAMENERKRITRDIHDVVGYTLTNNIMMMEAAIDMMQRNPLGVPSLINSARENAQDGLERIRESMYALRSSEIEHPTGLRAIIRLLNVYKRATSVNVDTNFGNVHWRYDEEVDSAIYHIVQESLMNSFRHGKARNIRLVIGEFDGNIDILIRDDGIGANGFTEGIGLKGMRERLSTLGGEIKTFGTAEGFVVHGVIPLERQKI